MTFVRDVFGNSGVQRQGGKQLLLFCSVYRSSNTEDILWILSLTIRFPDWHDVLPGIFGTSVDTNRTSRAPIRVTDISMHEQHEHAFDLTPVDALLLPRHAQAELQQQLQAEKAKVLAAEAAMFAQLSSSSTASHHYTGCKPVGLRSS